MQRLTRVMYIMILIAGVSAASGADRETIAIIGTGDMGGSLQMVKLYAPSNKGAYWVKRNFDRFNS